MQTDVNPGSRWHALAAEVLAGQPITRDEAGAVLASPDPELLDLLAASYRVRHHFFGNTVQLFFLMNAKSGLCPEDCGYCSQSKVSEAEIPRYNLLSAPMNVCAGIRIIINPFQRFTKMADLQRSWSLKYAVITR